MNDHKYKLVSAAIISLLLFYSFIVHAGSEPEQLISLTPGYHPDKPFNHPLIGLGYVRYQWKLLLSNAAPDDPPINVNIKLQPYPLGQVIEERDMDLNEFTPTFTWSPNGRQGWILKLHTELPGHKYLPGNNPPDTQTWIWQPAGHYVYEVTITKFSGEEATYQIPIMIKHPELQ